MPVDNYTPVYKKTVDSVDSFVHNPLFQGFLDQIGRMFCGKLIFFTNR